MHKDPAQHHQHSVLALRPTRRHGRLFFPRGNGHKFSFGAIETQVVFEKPLPNALNELNEHLTRADEQVLLNDIDVQTGMRNQITSKPQLQNGQLITHA
jgi:hypothetical protein